MPARRGGHRRAGRLPHSLHGYFLRAGRSDVPVILEVDRDRDGRSFSARHVVAVQEGEVIFSMITSFHAEGEGGHFDDAPRRTTPEPEDTPQAGWTPLLQVREVTPTDFLKGVFTDCVWVRSAVSLGADPLMQRAGLTYLSDLGTGFGQQHRSLIGRGGPSIDHSRLVPRGHPGRRLGARRPAPGQGPQCAGHVPRLAAEPPGRARGDALPGAVCSRHRLVDERLPTRRRSRREGPSTTRGATRRRAAPGRLAAGWRGWPRSQRVASSRSLGPPGK